LKAPESIYLFEFEAETQWCSNTPPTVADAAAVKYIREDCAQRPAPCANSCEARAFEIEIRRLRGRLGEL